MAKTFIDANILIYVFCSVSKYRDRDSISKKFQEIQKNNTLYIDLIIISEFVNTWLKIAKNQSQPKMKFKKYRNSENGKQILKQIKAELDKILDICKIIKISCHKKKDIQNLFAISEIDFNDSHIINTCKKRNFSLFTTDNDFQDKGIQLIPL